MRDPADEEEVLAFLHSPEASRLLASGEAVISVSGTPLTAGQAMTLRVAITAYAQQMEHDGLGDDETGKAIAAGYLRNCREILALLMRSCR